MWRKMLQRRLVRPERSGWLLRRLPRQWRLRRPVGESLKRNRPRNSRTSLHSQLPFQMPFSATRDHCGFDFGPDREGSRRLPCACPSRTVDLSRALLSPRDRRTQRPDPQPEQPEQLKERDVQPANAQEEDMWVEGAGESTQPQSTQREAPQSTQREALLDAEALQAAKQAISDLRAAVRREQHSGLSLPTAVATVVRLRAAARRAVAGQTADRAADRAADGPQPDDAEEESGPAGEAPAVAPPEPKEWDHGELIAAAPPHLAHMHVSKPVCGGTGMEGRGRAGVRQRP